MNCIVHAHLNIHICIFIKLYTNGRLEYLDVYVLLPGLQKSSFWRTLTDSLENSATVELSIILSLTIHEKPMIDGHFLQPGCVYVQYRVTLTHIAIETHTHNAHTRARHAHPTTRHQCDPMRRVKLNSTATFGLEIEWPG